MALKNSSDEKKSGAAKSASKKTRAAKTAGGSVEESRSDNIIELPGPDAKESESSRDSDDSSAGKTGDSENKKSKRGEWFSKEDAGNFARKFFGFLDKSVEVSKKGLKTAGNAISDFGDKSVLRIELSQMKTKKARTLQALGQYAYEVFAEQASLKAHDETVEKLLSELKKLDDEIAAREATIAEKQEKSKK